MALNSFAISSLAVKGMEKGFEGASPLIATIDTDYAKEFEQKALNTGDSIEIALPPRPNPWVAGQDVSIQATEHERVNLTVAQFNTGRQISSAELALSDKEFMKEVVKPDVNGGIRHTEITLITAFLKQASMTDFDSVGVDPTNSLIWNRVRGKLELMLAPAGSEVYGMTDPISMAVLADNESKLFTPKEIVDKAALRGKIKELAGVGDLYSSVNIGRITNGSGSTTGVQVDGANQIGSSLLVKTVAAGTSYNPGQQFQVEGLSALDPEKKTVLPFPMSFTITDVIPIAANAATLKFAPAIITTGSLQNCAAAPADGAHVTFQGNPSKRYAQHLLYVEEALTMASLPLPAPDGEGGVVRNGSYRNIKMRTVKYTDWNSSQHRLRYDLFFGGAVKRWPWFWRIWGKEETP